MNKFAKYCFTLIPGLLTLGIISEAQAITTTLSDIYGDFDGDTLIYNFTSLPASDGSDGTLRLFTGTAGSFPGLDIDEAGEFFTLTIDGNNVGNYACNSDVGLITLSGIPSVDCQFDDTFSFTNDFGLNLSSLLSDGSLNIEAAFTSAVGFSSEQNDLLVELSYSESSAVPFEFSPTFGIFLLSIGLGLNKGKNYYQSKTKKINLN